MPGFGSGGPKEIKSEPIPENPEFQSVIVRNETDPDYGIKIRSNEEGFFNVQSDFGTGGVAWTDWGLVRIASISMPLSGIVDSTLNVSGGKDEVSLGENGNWTDGASFTGQHVAIDITSLTGTGNMTIAGDATNESTGAIQPLSEVIVVDEIANYQSSGKFYDVDSITFSAGITAINYDIYTIGYVDFVNSNHILTSYRCDLKSQSNTSDIKLRIIRVRDLGDKKYDMIDIENIGIDSTNSNGTRYDGVRTGIYDRSYTSNYNLWPNNRTLTLKQDDLYTHPEFTDERAKMLSAEKDEGFIVRLEGAPSGGLSSVDHIVLNLGVVLL